jgi:hypothetical protein
MNLYTILDRLDHTIRGKEAYLTQTEDKIQECKDKKLNAFTFCLAADILRLSIKELQAIRTDVLTAIDNQPKPV